MAEQPVSKRTYYFDLTYLLPLDPFCVLYQKVQTWSRNRLELQNAMGQTWELDQDVGMVVLKEATCVADIDSGLVPLNMFWNHNALKKR